jgi:hypothetical protein
VTKVDEQLEIKAYYAGHVLGAAMFQIRVGSQSLVYTGDYNMTPDRHLVCFPSCNAKQYCQSKRRPRVNVERMWHHNLLPGVGIQYLLVFQFIITNTDRLYHVLKGILPSHDIDFSKKLFLCGSFLKKTSCAFELALIFRVQPGSTNADPTF